ncbi:hypothetical protein [Lentzea cavernae]|uniref:SseB protein N-terminal domain-containing protein n=1 Tax=Lentzea cavernae TaxID=2020703 RepID=A0ABQ3M5X6_9PSEU|nr:hypothetical protein [Lentzea cavernae]GHH34535.1 hypothetical protein GCM10017774_18680 [Lentzea cavernae]
MNSALAELLEHRSDYDYLPILGAVADHGVFIPLAANGSVMFGAGPHLPCFASEESCREWMPEAEASVFCDALGLMDVYELTDVVTMGFPSPEGVGGIPVPLLHRVLRERGSDTLGERLLPRPSAHALAGALREAVGRRIEEFPAVKVVWVSDGRLADAGEVHLMVHVAVDEPMPSPSADALLDVLAGDVVRRDGDPRVVAFSVNTTTDADIVTWLEGMGLDSVRAPERPAKRWWHRS